MGPNSALAERFFNASAAGDGHAMRALCAPEMSWSLNGGPALDLDATMAMLPAVRSVLRDHRYENAVRSDTEDGFVVEHDFAGTLPDGTQLRAAVCVVATMKNGKITSGREYFDSAAVAGLSRALSR